MQTVRVPCATKTIDDSTAVPADLYAEFLRAGEKARSSGQHTLTRSRLGVMTLRNASLKPTRASTVVSPVAVSRLATRTVQDVPDALSSVLEMVSLLWRLLCQEEAPDENEATSLSTPLLPGILLGRPQGPSLY